METTYQELQALLEQYGSPLYVFEEQKFRDNYHYLQKTFQDRYENYRISYSYKTNYTPYVAETVKSLGGYAEVVSEMEYRIAKKLGYEDNKIIFNGPNKGSCGQEAFLNGCMVNADSLCELDALCRTAKMHPEKQLSLGIRVNLNLGQNFISRFGIEEAQLPEAFEKVSRIPNLTAAGLHCHISRCRGLEAWKNRAEIMLTLADRYFSDPPQYIDLGSGMFGSMDPFFAAQFDNIPTYEEYADAAAGTFQKHYRGESRKPLLFTEPGTTLINRFVNMVSRVEAIKTIRGKTFAVLDCSIHNLGETSILKELPIWVIHGEGPQENYEDLEFAGYTCLEQDILRRGYCGTLSVGDYVIFGNVGGYSNVLKPPFIRPNCAMTARTPDGSFRLIKKAECFEDLLGTYIF